MGENVKLEKIGARAVCAEEACRCDGGCELGRRTFLAALRAIEEAGYAVVPNERTERARRIASFGRNPTL